MSDRKALHRRARRSKRIKILEKVYPTNVVDMVGAVHEQEIIKITD